MKISRHKFELLLAEKELSIIRLAELSGISRQNVSTIKQRGTCNPATAAKLARGLGVPVVELVEQEEKA